MRIEVDEQAADVISTLCDGYLRYHGMSGFDLVQVVKKSIRLEEPVTDGSAEVLEELRQADLEAAAYGAPDNDKPDA